jgi:hypothetical protein
LVRILPQTLLEANITSSLRTKLLPTPGQVAALPAVRAEGIAVLPDLAPTVTRKLAALACWRDAG